MNTASRFPLGVGENINLVYTDSGKVKAILTSPKNNDFSNQLLQFSEFPEGLKLEFFDKENNKSVLTADHGVLYNQTNLVDLRGNVVLTTHDGRTLKSPQLYWDQNNQWIFTEEKFNFVGPDTELNAIRLDANRDFTTISAGEPVGSVTTKDN